ncbi:MAG: helix-turn-helix domain-containing protein, partial [Clostridia bacterium]|nr:helix-turn-helix domain-containing protein [Clostridia bacterium]
KVEDGKWYGLASKLTHNELAAIVGSARVTISKLINELCDDGFIRIINRRAQVNMAAYEKFLADHAED